MAILLNTTPVRVSSIQIMQVRVQNKGKSVWKSRYDGDVLGTSSERLCLNHPIMDVVESCGGKCANLFRVYKLIMVSRVPGYGHLEYLVLELLCLSHHYI